jgi:hypothetical protein
MNQPDGAAVAEDVQARLRSRAAQAESVLRARGHICTFFHNANEEYQALLPFITQGFAVGDRSFHVVDPAARADHLRRLTTVGIDVTTAEQRGQLALLNNTEVYSATSAFDESRMLAFFANTLEDGRRQGYRQTRILAHDNPAGRPPDDAWVDYESKVNDVLRPYGDPLICIYDLSKVHGALVFDIMRTHPMVIIGGALYENPFYVPPVELRQQRRNHGSRDAAVERT